MPKFKTEHPRVTVIMGSKSDWDTMQRTHKTLDELGIEHEVRVYSAHRTPTELTEYLADIEERGVRVIIAAAGGAAHLAGVIASKTVLPIVAVPMQAWSLDGLDSLLSTVQMPKGIPVASMAIGSHGAVNAALFAAQILATNDPALSKRLKEHRQEQAEAVLSSQVGD
jgi:5-(carboxyamino)imidazole ribonucleotide mutase